MLASTLVLFDHVSSCACLAIAASAPVSEYGEG